MDEYNCVDGTFRYGNASQTLTLNKGEMLHQITTGTTGNDWYKICTDIAS
jgi:hypothetical protein